jgi:hypothetical protein
MARARRARATVEQRDLPEYLAGLEQVEDGFLALGRDGVDAHPAHQHAAERVAGIALGEDLVVGLEVPDGRELDQAVEERRGGLAKQHVPREERAQGIGGIAGHREPRRTHSGHPIPASSPCTVRARQRIHLPGFRNVRSSLMSSSTLKGL